MAPRSVGTGGGRPPPVTRWRGVILVPTATIRVWPLRDVPVMPWPSN
jgi:hypothetical protein